MRSDIALLGVASGLAAQDQGTADGPACLQCSPHLLQQMQQDERFYWHNTLQLLPQHASLSTLHRVSELCQRLALSVQQLVSAGKSFVVIGGDHSIAVGTWSAVAEAYRHVGAMGLLWIDAHLDAHTPATSLSGAIHGMPVASLLGYGAPELTQLVSNNPKILPQHLCIVGARSYEDGEHALLQRLGVKIFYMSEVTARGLPAVMRDALAIVNQAPAGFGVTIDVDAVDPEDAPGVGSPEVNGIAGAALCAALQSIHGMPHFLGLEITEFNPHHDKSACTERLVCAMMRSVFLP